MISVVVPVYNVEKYLDECIESLLNQSYQNIEIILVNDGSTDNSYDICKKWQNKSSKIKIVNKKNGGLSSARNAGLDFASGDYVAFVDSDDYIDPMMLMHMRRAFDAKEISAVVCQLETFIDGTSCTDLYLPLSQYGTISSKHFIRCILQHKADNAVCNKLYKKCDIGGLRFKTGVINEDILFNIEFLLGTRYVYYVKEPYYKYRLRQGSITQQANPKLFDFIDNSFTIRERILKKYGNEYDKETKGYIYYEISNFISVVEKYNAREQFSDEVKFCLNFLKDNKLDFVFNGNCCLRQKTKMLFVLMFPNFFRILTKR